MTTPSNHEVIETFIHYGGSFASQLGKTLLNTDSGAYCLVELAKCYGPADEGNQIKVIRLLEQARLIVGMNQSDRIQLIADEFPDLWLQYQDMAKARVSSEAQIALGDD